jgi:PPOX class probable F420-dependent enzyme
MGTLSRADLDRFLEGSSIVAILATLDEDGQPYQVPVWYEWDGSRLWIVSKPEAAYVKNLQRDPRASVCIATQTLPYVRVLVQGEVTLVDTDEEWLPMGLRMAERYLGPEEGAAYIEKTRTWKRVFLRLQPTRIRSWDGGASGHEWGERFIQRRP